MKGIFNKVILLIVFVAVAVMSVRLITVLVPQKAQTIDPSEGIAYLSERETAIYTEPSPTPVPTEPTSETVTYYEIKDNNFKAAFKDIYFCGDSITQAMYEYGILDIYHVTAAIGVGPSHIDRNLNYIVALNPEILVLHYGVNVMGSESDALPFIENYKKSIEALQEQLPDTIRRSRKCAPNWVSTISITPRCLRILKRIIMKVTESIRSIHIILSSIFLISTRRS